MPYFVYILLSKKDGRLYVGCTRDVAQRVKRHNNNEVPATRNRRPLVLVYSQKFLEKADAFERERFLKSLWGAREKKGILKEYISKIGHAS